MCLQINVGNFRGPFCSPPFTPRNDANLSCSFMMYSCFEITTYITFSGKFLQLFYKNVHIL